MDKIKKGCGWNGLKWLHHQAIHNFKRWESYWKITFVSTFATMIILPAKTVQDVPRVTFLHYIILTSHINPVIALTIICILLPLPSSLTACLNVRPTVWSNSKPSFPPIPGLTHILWATTKCWQWSVTWHWARAQVTAAFLPTPTSHGATPTVGCPERRDKDT